MTAAVFHAVGIVGVPGTGFGVTGSTQHGPNDTMLDPVFNTIGGVVIGIWRQCISPTSSTPSRSARRSVKKPDRPQTYFSRTAGRSNVSSYPTAAADTVGHSPSVRVS